MKPRKRITHAPAGRFLRYRHLTLPARLARLRAAYTRAPLLAGLVRKV